ncbi:MAG: hypothetical protein ROW48_00275 [Bellilinea sp.]
MKNVIQIKSPVRVCEEGVLCQPTPALPALWFGFARQPPANRACRGLRAGLPGDCEEYIEQCRCPPAELPPAVA